MEAQCEVVCLAVLWIDSRTYQCNLGEFEVVKNPMDSIFHMKWKLGLLYARRIPGFPRILFGRERGNLRYARLGLIKWLMYSPRKTLRGKLPVRYQGLTLRFAVNVDFLFLIKYLD